MQWLEEVSAIAVCYTAEEITLAGDRLVKGKFFPLPGEAESAFHIAQVSLRKSVTAQQGARDWRTEFDVLANWLIGRKILLHDREWLSPDGWCDKHPAERASCATDARLARLVDEADARAIQPIWRAVLDERHREETHDLDPLSYDIRRARDSETGYGQRPDGSFYETTWPGGGPGALSFNERIEKIESRANALWGEAAYDMKSAA